MPGANQLQTLWAKHNGQWRDPTQALSPWTGSAVDPRLLRSRASGDWWDVLDRLKVTLVVTREYEHLIMAVAVVDGQPEVSYLPLPHPSGLAVDRASRTVVVASTRNPNQVYELAPISKTLPRSDIDRPDVSGRPLMPTRSTIHAGATYMHDLAFIGGRLHANSVGQNAIVDLPSDGGGSPVWWPRCIERAGRPDFGRNWIQLNSIAAGPDLESSYFTASTEAMSARRPGHRNFPVDRRGVIFSGASREPCVRGLTRPHSARLHRRRLWVDDSGYGQLCVRRGADLDTVCELPGWTRGLCFRSDVAFVGTSRVIPRFRQYAPGLNVERSRCALHAVDVASGRVLGSLDWPYGNQIFAIEWIDRSHATGLPFRNMSRTRDSDASRLFYSFDTPRRSRTNDQ